MINLIAEKIIRAYKKHRCSLCGKNIEKGTRYVWQKNICDGEFYEFRNHIACNNICNAIWDYADPEEGMDEDLFWDSCQEICQVFVCPDCHTSLRISGNARGMKPVVLIGFMSSSRNTSCTAPAGEVKQKDIARELGLTQVAVSAMINNSSITLLQLLKLTDLLNIHEDDFKILIGG